MTNREVIQLFAKYEPELIAECFDDCCCLGYEHISVQYFTKDWLDTEYSDDFFRKQDVERLLEKQEETEIKSAPWQCVNYILNKDQAKRFIDAIDASEKWNEEHKK